MGAKLVESYPPQSWDLNIIENCWGILDTKLQGRRPSSLRGFKQVLKQAWDEVSMHAIHELVDSWPERVQAVVENEGAWP